MEPKQPRPEEKNSIPERYPASGAPCVRIPPPTGYPRHMLETEVAPGVHRIEDAYTNWYLVEGDDGLTVVDCGVPTSWASFLDAVKTIGRTTDDVRAVVLTHAHFDHVGFAERARTELGVPVHVHENDVPLTRHPWRYDHERPRALYLTTQVRAMPIVASLVRNRAFWPAAIKEVVRFDDATHTLPVPGNPILLRTPGHTLGHTSLHLRDRDAVIVGDAFVMLDPYTGKQGPRVVARAATADSERNLRTLDALAATGATTGLTGHGPAWTGGLEAAVALARENGVA
jgi:glyoxylase-like metal-dependent hydrolase (beta-lactamase superfamily II)